MSKKGSQETQKKTTRIKLVRWAGLARVSVSAEAYSLSRLDKSDLSFLMAANIKKYVYAMVVIVGPAQIFHTKLMNFKSFRSKK